MPRLSPYYGVRRYRRGRAGEGCWRNESEEPENLGLVCDSLSVGAKEFGHPDHEQDTGPDQYDQRHDEDQAKRRGLVEAQRLVHGTPPWTRSAMHASPRA